MIRRGTDEYGNRYPEEKAFELASTVIIIAVLLLPIFLAFFGCNTPFIPTPEPDPIHVTIPPQTDYKAVMAWEIAKVYNGTPTPRPTPGPNPTPTPPDGKIKVGDDCPAPCEDGYTFGDGANPQVCWKCNGDGRADEGDPILDPDNQQIAPTLAPPLPEIKMIAPIEIHVEKGNPSEESLAQPEIPSVYYIEKDGSTYMWDETLRVFGNGTDQIEFQSDMNIQDVQEITINYGEYFRRFPVLRKLVEKQYGTKSGPTREPENGGSSD